MVPLRLLGPLVPLLALLAAALPEPAHAAPPRGNVLSKRTQLRYQDVLTTRGGTRWRGKIVERGDVFRIKLEDNSEVAVPKEEVASITRELHPGLPHKGQWDARGAVGFEVAFATGERAGVQYGPMVELGLGRNLGGPFEPEAVLILSPIGPTEGSYTPQAGLGFRYYLQAFDRAKPYAATQLVLWGTQADLGLRSGGGVQLDLTPNVGIGVSQGVTLMTQARPSTSAAVGYHVAFQAQGRF